MRWHGVRQLAAGAVVALFVVLSGCSVFSYAPTPLPTPEPVPSVAPAPIKPPVDCGNPVASYAPSEAQPKPGAMPAGSTMKRIQNRGRLIAGVSADTYLMGARNPLTGTIEGFDIDFVKAIAQAILGDEKAYELRVITAAQRIPVLAAQEVDLVARNMTITCERWTEVAFSSEYYSSGQKVLVRRGSAATTLADLAGLRVCAPRGTSSLANLIKLAPDAVPVPADSHTGCLALFQGGSVDAITGDDTVLAGLAAQDPYAFVPQQKAFSSEPYGLAMNADQVDLVRFVNATLEQMRTDGEWNSIYNTWLSEPLGKAPAPPKAVYGRKR